MSFLDNSNKAVLWEVLKESTIFNGLNSSHFEIIKNLFENITGYEVKEVGRPLQPDSKEDLTQLKNWICQLLNKDYKNGFTYLWNLSTLYTFNIDDDEDRKFPYLGKCQVISSGKVLCDNGILDFYKKFNKSYFA